MHIFHRFLDRRVPGPAAYECLKFRQAERRKCSMTLMFSESTAPVLYAKRIAP